MLRTNGVEVSRGVVERVVREMDWRGACKRRRVRTTVADPTSVVFLPFRRSRHPETLVTHVYSRPTFRATARSWSMSPSIRSLRASFVIGLACEKSGT